MILRPLALALLLSLGACASTDQQKLGAAATSSLSDLNIVNAPIPDVLQQAQKAPYALTEDSRCETLQAGIAALDEALGPDLDQPASAAHPGLIERGGHLATDTVAHAVEGLMPYRSWVRKLSGAERYSQQVAAAIAAGTVRRAFLKGVRVARGC